MIVETEEDEEETELIEQEGKPADGKKPVGQATHVKRVCSQTKQKSFLCLGHNSPHSKTLGVPGASLMSGTRTRTEAGGSATLSILDLVMIQGGVLGWERAPRLVNEQI